MTARPLLHVEGLEVSFGTEAGLVRAVDGVSLELRRGELLALVGESGSGKSVAMLTLMGLTRAANANVGGRALLRTGEGELELLAASEEELRRVRGARLAMIFQDPLSALNPVLRVGDQIAEQILAHEDVDGDQAMERAAVLLERVGIPHAADRARAYPHELSGGMRQRVMVAMALSCGPDVLIADEPTTALDVTVQAQILELVGGLRDAGDAGVILVTHDLGVVAQVADRVAVMYGGRIVEQGAVDEVFHDPQHPYTWGLLGSIARVDERRRERLAAIPGQPPSLADPPRGCHFRPRCPHEFDRCPATPALEPRLGESPDHRDRCWLDPDEKRARRAVDGRIGLVPRATA